MAAIRFLVRSYKVFDIVDAGEYAALNATYKDYLKMILSCGVINLSEGCQTRSALWTMFPEGTATRVGLDALLPSPVEEPDE